MPAPGPLRHAVQIHVTQIDPGKLPARHPQFAELLGLPVWKPPIQLTAQLALGQFNALSQRPLGVDPQSDGHVTIRLVDLAWEAPGVTLQIGNRITRIYVGEPREQKVDWMVTMVTPKGHYGRPTLLFVSYKNLKSQSALGQAGA